MARLVVGLLLALFLSAQAGPDVETEPLEPLPPRPPTFEDGVMAYSRGDPGRALEIWRPLAENGNPDAQYSIGYLYVRGEGVLADARTAAKWFRRAAEQGDPDSQLHLGLLYAQGEGVGRDLIEAYKWFSLAYRGYAPGEQRDLAFRNRENAASELEPEEIEEAERRVEAWRPKRR